MLAAERHREILTRLRSGGSVRVATLASDLSVTEETIRRDLEKLDQAGRVIRTHGGAVAIDDDRRELPFGIRETVNLKAKRLIAKRAIEYIHEGDVIALDASSTAREVARILPDLFVTVITNCLAVTSSLVDRKSVRVISTGGRLDTRSLAYLGSMAEHALRRFNISKVFLSSMGVDLARGASVTEGSQAGMKRGMLELASRRYLLVDASKLGVSAVEFFAELDEFDVVITDASRDHSFVQSMLGLGVTVDCVEDS